MTWALTLLVYKKHIGQKGYCDVRRQLQNNICIASLFPNPTQVARTYLENWIRLLMYVNRAPTLWIWFCGAFLRHGFCRYFSGTPQGWPMLPSTQTVNDKIIHTGSGLHRHRFKTCQQQFNTLRGIRKVIDYDNKRWSRRVPFKPDKTSNSVHNLLG